MTGGARPGSGVDEAFLRRWAERLAAVAAPGAVAVLLKGSHARGEPGPHSDVDFDVLVAAGPREDYLAYLVERDGRLLHVSAAVRDVDSWLAEESEPQDWALRLPAVESARGIWYADETWRRRLDRTELPRPPGHAELEDLVEDLAKVANARLGGDDLGVRVAAQGVARLLPSVLQYVNPPVRVGTVRAAVTAALELPVHPAGYREDLLACWGLSEPALPVGEVARAALRLVTGTVDLVAAAVRSGDCPALEGVLTADELAVLRDGRLRRYLDQLGADLT